MLYIRLNPMHLYSLFPCRRQLTAPKCFSSWHTPRDAVRFHSPRAGTNTPQCFCILWGRARSPGGLSLQLNKRWDPGFYMPLKPAAGACVMLGKATCTTPSIHPSFPHRPYHSFIRPLSLSIYPAFKKEKKKVNRRSSSFFSMEDPSTLPSCPSILTP